MIVTTVTSEALKIQKNLNVHDKLEALQYVLNARASGC
jgi:hypothetical protein